MEPCCSTQAKLLRLRNDYETHTLQNRRYELTKLNFALAVRLTSEMKLEHIFITHWHEHPHTKSSTGGPEKLVRIDRKYRERVALRVRHPGAQPSSSPSGLMGVKGAHTSREDSSQMQPACPFRTLSTELRNGLNTAITAVWILACLNTTLGCTIVGNDWNS